MGRTIRFRGKDLKTGEWRYGFYTQGAFVDPLFGEEHVRHIIHSDTLYDINPETIGQFTGLTDNDGKEIYDGDIVHGFYKGRYEKQTLVCIIEWDKDNACFDIHPLVEPDDEAGLLSEPDEITVIGNIYDNPELLGQTK